MSTQEKKEINQQNNEAVETAESKEAEKKRKKEEKAKKADERKLKKQQAAEERANRSKKNTVVSVTFEDVKENKVLFGDLPLIQSAIEDSNPKTSITGVDYADISDLDKQKVDQTVCLRARIHTVRGKGGSAFIVLRQGYYTAQATIFSGGEIPKQMAKWCQELSRETVVEVVALVTLAPEPVKSTTQHDIELSIKKIYCVSRANPLPFQLEDAMKPDMEDESEKIPENSSTPPSENASSTTTTTTTTTGGAHDHLRGVGRDVRLNNRVIDVRVPAHIAIFKIQSAIQLFFRQFLYTKGFTEIHTPKLIGTASESGASVFEVKYFGSAAYLAQSPQLYKQIAVEADLMKVFEIAPVFRAENANTHRHLTEFMGLDLEMDIKHHYSEVLDIIDEMFVYIFEGLKKDFAKEIEIIKEQYGFKPLVYNVGKKNLRLKFSEGLKMLREAGETIGDYDDISTPQEKLLGKLVKEKYNTDFYILEKYPMSCRPFYTMPCPQDPNYSNSYDVMIRGEEVASGAQRIHDPDLLAKVASEKGVSLGPMQAYVDSFKYGSWPHGGAGFGLERVVMLFLGIGNVRRVSLFPRDPKRLTP